jgi:hypothetical protein
MKIRLTVVMDFDDVQTGREAVDKFLDLDWNADNIKSVDAHKVEQFFSAKNSELQEAK